MIIVIPHLPPSDMRIPLKSGFVCFGGVTEGVFQTSVGRIQVVFKYADYPVCNYLFTDHPTEKQFKEAMASELELQEGDVWID